MPDDEPASDEQEILHTSGPMSPEELVGDQVEITTDVWIGKEHKTIDIPAGSTGTVVGWDGEQFEIAFTIGLELKTLRLPVSLFATVTRPCSMEKRLT